MKVASRHTYAAPPDAVFAAMTTPDVLVEKYTALGHRDVEILEHAARGGTVRLRSRRGVPIDVPGFAKRFLSPVNTVEQVDEWEPPTAAGVRHGTWQASAAGVPVKTAGTQRLTPAPGGGTVLEVVGEVSCSIPLVGGKLASFVGGTVESTVRAEQEFYDGYLARQAKPAKKAAAAAKAAPAKRTTKKA